MGKKWKRYSLRSLNTIAIKESADPVVVMDRGKEQLDGDSPEKQAPEMPQDEPKALPYAYPLAPGAMPKTAWPERRI